VGGTLAGYAGPLCLGVAVLGILALALDWGLGTLLAGMLLAGYGIWPGQNDYLKDVGMIVTLFGVVLTLTGWQVMKIAWFPIVFLICAIPWPGLVYSKIAMPLQYLAANVAVVVMNFGGVETYVEGTKIVIDEVGHERVLNVAEACAGMRSLMTFITAGAAIGFVFGNRPLWQRLVIVASAVPIAVVCNVMRVGGQGLLDVYVSQELSRGFAHGFAGLVMLLPAFVMLLGVVWVLDNLYVEEDDESDASTKGRGKGKLVAARASGTTPGQGSGEPTKGTKGKGAFA
jgi:exosortase